MNRKQFWLVSLAVLTALFIGASFSSFYRSSSAQGLKVSGTPWEYAAVSGVEIIAGETRVNICVYTASGCEAKSNLILPANDTKGLAGTAKQNAIAKAVFYLGEAGWEMVGSADIPVSNFDNQKRTSATDGHTFQIFFKRRKQ